MIFILVFGGGCSQIAILNRDYYNGIMGNFLDEHQKTSEIVIAYSKAVVSGYPYIANLRRNTARIRYTLFKYYVQSKYNFHVAAMSFFPTETENDNQYSKGLIDIAPVVSSLVHILENAAMSEVSPWGVNYDYVEICRNGDPNQCVSRNYYYCEGRLLVFHY